LIVENVLGRTRLQMAEGRLSETGWYQRFDEARKRELREAGRGQLRLLLHYLREDGEEVLPEAQGIGREYERLGREAGLSLTETVNVFLYFRDFLYDSVMEVYQASGHRAAREWANLHRRVAAFTNAILLALIETREQRLSSGQAAGEPSGHVAAGTMGPSIDGQPGQSTSGSMGQRANSPVSEQITRAVPGVTGQLIEDSPPA
jgi:hypothetical protein